MPLEFPVGLGRVIRGWDIGVMSMELGEKAELTIQSDYGYGDRGRGRLIPGGATMVFKVQLLEINGQSATALPEEPEQEEEEEIQVEPETEQKPMEQEEPEV